MELLEILTQVLCPTSEAASQCQNFISNHSDAAYGVIGQLFYFLLFPTIFILLFVWMAVERMNVDKKISTLASVGVLIFVVMSGWYPLFLILSEVWFIVLILGGLFYILIHRGHFGKDNKGGGGGGKGRFFGEIGSGLGSIMWKQATGQIGDLEKQIQQNIDSMWALCHKMQGATSTSDIDNVYVSFTSILDRTQVLLRELRDVTGISGVKIGGDFNRMQAKVMDVTTHMNQMHKKRLGHSKAA